VLAYLGVIYSGVLENTGEKLALFPGGELGENHRAVGLLVQPEHDLESN